MPRISNPFHELYVSETIAPEDFVTLFSPFLVEHAQELFQVGNVVVKGVQGSGKSMLLSLLKPEIQIAYFTAGVQFPLPQDDARFIGAGINLARSAATDFGQRRLQEENGPDLGAVSAVYFGDFLNYWVVEDILESVSKLDDACEGKLARSWNINTHGGRLDEFAQWLAAQDCWLGFLDGIRNCEELRKRLRKRLTLYRSFLNFNMERLPTEIATTKTPVGEPISQTAKGLREIGIIPKEMPVFVRVDQYEEVGRFASDVHAHRVEPKFRRLINKALATRDPKVSYRIGARRYAWREDLRIFGSEANLEHERNYRVIDLDDLLRRKENRRTWIFPDFSDDVLKRRLEFAGYELEGGGETLSRQVFGKTPSPENEAKVYAGSDAERSLDLVEQWPEGWKVYLRELSETSPLSANLGAAMLRQQKGSRMLEQEPPANGLSWKSKSWWRKERVHQALLQMAARRQQRLRWSGEDDLRVLSGGNILVFISLAREIFSTWSRYESKHPIVNNKRVRFPIDTKEQTVGIFQASEYWYQKIMEQPNGHTYRRFVSFLGRSFRKRLLADKGMAYPGHNGFSLDEDELGEYVELDKFLKQAVDYGHLFDARHTTNREDKRPRNKWYLAPILSPRFQIPAKHAKEPLYVKVSEALSWMEAAKGNREAQEVRRTKPQDGRSDQLELF